MPLILVAICDIRLSYAGTSCLIKALRALCAVCKLIQRDDAIPPQQKIYTVYSIDIIMIFAVWSYSIFALRYLRDLFDQISTWGKSQSGW